LDINENFTRADFGLAMLEKYDSSNNHIKIMESKTNKELHKSSYKDLYFALGKVYEDIGDFDKSFLYIKKGNDIKKEITNYQIEKDKKLFEEIISFQEKNELNNNSKENMKNVIFILGMPRTGTSMVEQIISNHSEVEGGGEISLLSFYLDRFFNNKNKNLDINEHLNLIKKEYLDYLNKITKSKNSIYMTTDSSDYLRDTVSLLNEYKDSFGTFSSSILKKNDELYGISKYQRKALENGGKIYLLTLWNY